MVNEETLTPPMRFGWVGLGAMGYPMAGQLRRKLPRTSTLWIYDIDFALTTRFLEEEARFTENGTHGAQVCIGRNSREIAEESVSLCCLAYIPVLTLCRRQDFIITIVPEGMMNVELWHQSHELSLSGVHVRAVYLDKETGLLSVSDTSRKHFVDWSVPNNAMH